MLRYIGKEYDGAPFQLFGRAHLCALVLVVLINLSFILVRNVPGPEIRVAIRYGLAAILILNELAWHLWNIKTGQWRVQTMLPLHLCSLFVLLSAVMLVTRSYRIYEFAFFLGIGGAVQALLTPDAGKYGFPHLRFFQVIISHAAIVSAAVYMTVVEGYRPYWSSLLHVLIGANLYMLLVGLINWRLGSNYLFIARKPDTPSMIDLLGPWPWYILSIEAFSFRGFPAPVPAICHPGLAVIRFCCGPAAVPVICLRDRSLKPLPWDG